MIRKAKALGLALVAVFAMSALVASAASAHAYMSEGNVNVKVKGAQIGEHVFEITGQQVTCTTASFATAGEITSPAATVTIHPTYTGCTAFGFVGATVTTTGCNYVFTAGAASGAKFENKLETECGTGQSITIVVGTCEVTIEPTQTFAASMNLTTNKAGPPKDVLLESNVTGIEATVLKSGFLCPLSVNAKGTHDTSTYTGNTTITGEHNSAAVGITVE